ncbi:monovalent cation:proton antiporter-2 (CPA2) family protein [Luteolibacter sp. SL250]|uniref:monovalent cation:proton antiporter-2 (CPA2) family protein n=1 Tax=Luteolibacter sp. SL250 TaxID=2995170 RepID=UPI00226D7F06|nr:monovalent cation:proton antiporter-2 (CPA2) family protein [Luteolibacter sp. SL250]WAC21585.1 monovalent cation:proton antiporter-2 (CPA2) family protein [Luteolibacter sp. SL250]
MGYENVFLQAVIYLTAAVVAILVGKRLGLGAVLGYLIAGAAIGPWGFSLIGKDAEQVAHFAEFGVVVMLFLIGLELQPLMLWRMRRQIVGLGSLQVVLCAVAVGGTAMAFGTGWKAGLAIGLILAMSSTAIVLQTLAEKGLLRTEAGQNSFSVLLFQDIAVIPILALLPLLGTGGAASAHGDGHHQSDAWMAQWPGWAQALVTFGAIILIIAVGRIAMRYVFQAIAKTRQREAFTGAALLLVIGVALLMTKVGLSPALGAFVAGVVLASSEYRHELESDLEPFKGLLLGVFFLGVGAGIDFGFIMEHPLLVIGGALGLILIKGAILQVLSMFSGLTGRQSLVFSASIAAGGEFAFVLISLSLASGVFPPDTGRALVAMVALSMAATPLLILLSKSIVARGLSGKEDREPDVKDDGNPVIICGFGRYGHAVGRLLRIRGYGCTILDNDSDQVELLRQLGIPVYYGDANRPDMLDLAGASRAKVLVVAIKDEAAASIIISNARRHHPHLRIYLRAHSRAEAYSYLGQGEQHIYRETLDSSLRMGADILEHLGLSSQEAKLAASVYFTRDEEMVRSMAEHRNKDDGEYLNAAREAVQSLDELLRSDLEREQRSQSTDG